MPLFVSRSPTALCLRQLEEDSPVPQPVEPKLVANCAGTRFPCYRYAPTPWLPGSSSSLSVVPDLEVPDLKSRDADAQSNDMGDFDVPVHVSAPTPADIEHKSTMDTVMLALWEDCAEQGLFRYDVTACPTKILPGPFGFIAQLNEGRANKKRPTEFRVDQVCQDFDAAKFNFTKAYMKEVLFQFEASNTNESQVEESSAASSSPNLVLINVSPIEYGHVLLVPKVLSSKTQLIDTDTLLLALHFAKESGNPYFRVGYNSLGAYATINHLHFQGYYLAAPFPCERVAILPLLGGKRKRGVTISRLLDYPVNGLVFEGAETFDDLAAVVGGLCVRLQQCNIPHNVLITDCGTRVFVFPQCYAERQATNQVPEHILDTGVNPAAFEIAGHVVLKRKQDYECFSEDTVWDLLAQVSLAEDRFQDVIKQALA